jgi:hypothetical protein
MISTARLVAWAKAEGLAAEETTLRELERAAVAYINEPGGRYFGAEDEIVENIPWRGEKVVRLGNEPTDLVLESWDGTGWAVVSSGDYLVAGRLVYLTDFRTTTGTTTHLRATYTAGYAETAPDVWDAPADIQQAVRMLVGHWFTNREAAVVGVASDEVAMGVRMILDKYR